MNDIVTFDNLLLLTSVGIIFLLIETKSLLNNIPITSMIFALGVCDLLELIGHKSLGIIFLMFIMFCNTVYSITKEHGTPPGRKIINYLSKIKFLKDTQNA